MSEGVLLRDLILGGAGRLAAAGVAEPRREAVRLWADLAGLESYALPLPEPTVDPASVERFQAAVERRAGGEPLSYVTGIAGFRRLTLAADPRALIPRPETEGLVDLLLAHRTAGRVADVGTGTGCIALALADEGEYRQVIGVERSRGALALAGENRDRTGLRVDLVADDLLSGFADGCLDAVISNPPYLTESEYEALDVAVRSHEPAEALASGRDGLRATEAVLAGAARVLIPGGVVALEIDAARPRESAAASAVSPRAEERDAVIWEKAEELGRLIGQTQEYKALRRAEGALRDDQDAQAKVELIQKLARQMDELVSQGQMPDQATAETYETAVRELEVSPTGQAYAVARANFEKVMIRVNQLIAQGMEKGATSSIITLG